MGKYTGMDPTLFLTSVPESVFNEAFRNRMAGAVDNPNKIVVMPEFDTSEALTIGLKSLSGLHEQLEYLFAFLVPISVTRDVFVPWANLDVEALSGPGLEGTRRDPNALDKLVFRFPVKFLCFSRQLDARCKPANIMLVRGWHFDLDAFSARFVDYQRMNTLSRESYVDTLAVSFDEF